MVMTCKRSVETADPSPHNASKRCCARKPSLPQEVPLGNDLRHPRTLSTVAIRGGSEYITFGIDGGGILGCLAINAFMVLPLKGATPEEHNTLTAAMK